MRTITELEEMKAIQLEIMDRVHDFCEKEGVNYFLSHGSLIGAIRHKGFIPWDDDIDIFMLRNDYEKFCRIFPLKQSEYGLEIVNSNTKPFFCRPMSKVIDIKTLLLEPNYLCDDPIGVNIDIWPLDGAPSDYKEWGNHIKKISILMKLLYGRIVKFSACKGLIAKVVHICLLPVSPLIIVDRVIKHQKKYSLEDNECVTCYVDPYKKLFKKEWFSNRLLIPFEDRQYYIPENADGVLKSIYGDYMKLPPIEKQIPHHVTNAYWKD